MSELVRCAALALALSFTAAGSHAQDKYPSMPVRLLTPFAPGGGSDILARIIGPQVSEALGQTVVVKTGPAAAAPWAPGLRYAPNPTATR